MAIPKPKIPHYELLSLIDQRPTCQVWLGRDERLGRYAAIKILPRAEQACTQENRADRELLALRALQERIGHTHPNLVTIYEANVSSEYLYYVMELADDISGQFPVDPSCYRPATLANRLAQSLPSSEQCILYTQQLLQGLAELHRCRIVHRDVKPSNCVFVAGVLKLADFGFVKPVGNDISVVGTTGYIPPDGILDEKADVYAAGKVIYQMITGLPASRFPLLGAQAGRVVQELPLAVLNQLAIQACSPDRKQRFANAIQMLQTLQDRLRQLATNLHQPRAPLPSDAAVSAELPLSSAAPGLFHQTPLWMWSVGVITLAALVLIFLAAFWPRSESPQAAPKPTVSVNFLAGPWEAEILLDGQPLLGPDQKPYRTPCTVPDLPAQSHRVAFRLPSGETWELGEIDFSSVRELALPFPAPPSPLSEKK